LQRELHQLVEAEFLYQQGLPPQATYRFKHALIQDTAYQSLLRSTRQRHHQHVAQVLEGQFPELCETQPELLAHHYTEAGLIEQAVGYWQRAGERSNARSAYVEAVAHCTKGLTLLMTLPDTPERMQCELAMQLTLGSAFMAIKGHGAPEVEHAYTRARALCQWVENTPQYFRVLRGLWAFALARSTLQTAREWGEQLLTLAQGGQDPPSLLQAHLALGLPLFHLGECTTARVHLERAITFYDLQRHRSLAFRAGQDLGVTSLACVAWVLWVLGYPDQAQQRSQEALTLAQELAHPASLAYALHYAGVVHQLRREEHAARMRAEVVMTLATEQGFAQRVAQGAILRGWALAAQGQEAEGLEQMRQGLAAYQATGAEVGRPHMLALLAEVYRKGVQAEEGLRAIAEAQATVHTTGERYYEPELYRLKGELLLARSPEQHAEVATCFRQALALACQQQAKAWELRAATSLARLWQLQGKRAEAHALLEPIYGWFTEGFDTADLQDAKALLVRLG
jgi:predicted ATPase